VSLKHFVCGISMLTIAETESQVVGCWKVCCASTYTA